MRYGIAAVWVSLLYGYRLALNARAFRGLENIQKWFSRLAQIGVWQVLLAHLEDIADNEYAMTDCKIMLVNLHIYGGRKNEQHE
jgi:hypothetical protein